MALVGDAGYAPGPAVGGGTSLAVVGAYLVARALAEAGGDHAVAFPAYQSQVDDYARRCRAVAPAVLRRGIPRSRGQLLFSETAMRLLPHIPGALRARLMSGSASSTLSNFAVPDPLPRARSPRPRSPGSGSAPLH